jgi:hypothetical protein
LKRPFRVAYASAESKVNHFVAIDDSFFGEASGSVHYGPKETEVVSDLEKGCLLLESDEFKAVDNLAGLRDFGLNRVSLAALTGALVHKISSENLIYPWQLFKIDEPREIRTSFTVGIDNPQVMHDEIMTARYPIIKVKLGFDGDEELVQELKDIRGKVFRIDANGGWLPDKAEKMIYLLRDIDVELLEQPTGPEFIKEWKHIKGNSRIPLVVDEGLYGLEDYFNFSDYIDGVNIKMAKSGGIIEAIRIAGQAKKDRLIVMLGCMLESSIGISQSIYMSSLADYFDLDGPLLLNEDVATGIVFNLEKISVDENIIGGPKLKKEFLDGRIN